MSLRSLCIALAAALLMARAAAQPHKSKIVILPFGETPAESLQPLLPHIGRIFRCEAAIGACRPLPPGAYNPRRGQYRSTALIEELKSSPDPEVERLLGVADVDLYVSPLNFVFGQAAETVAVISTTRLKPEAYGEPPDHKLFQRRLLTEAVHELGHTYGLAHCRDAKCVMYFSNSLADTDIKGSDFCPSCRKRLAKALGVKRARD